MFVYPPGDVEGDDAMQDARVHACRSDQLECDDDVSN
jgi:hypothetical protein